MKRFQGFVAATLITVVVGVGMVGIGANALSNPNSVPVSDSPAKAAQVSTSASTADPAAAQIDQLQNLIKQYQSREKQYQTEVQSLSQKLADANSQVDQLQQVLQALQDRGIIQITRDGRIFLRGG